MRASEVLAGLLILSVLPSWAYASDPFVYLERRSATTLNPLYMRQMQELRLAELLYSTLYIEDTSYTLTEDLVQTDAMEISSDRKSIVIKKLKPKLWHDGSPVSMADVLFSLEAHIERHPFARERYKSAKLKKDELHVEFLRPVAEPKRIFRAIRMLSRKHYKHSKTFDRNRTRVVGSGPYKLKKWSNNVISMEKSEQSDVQIDEVKMRVVRDDNAQLSMMKTGQADAVIRVYPRELPHYNILAAQGKVRIQPYQSVSWWYVGINHRNIHFQGDEGQLVKEAMVYALDRRALLEHLGGGHVMSGPFVRQQLCHDRRVKPRAISDPKLKAQKIEELMEKAGYILAEGGVYKHPKKGLLDLSLVVSRERLEKGKDAVIGLVDQLSKFGFAIKLVDLPHTQEIDRIYNKGDFDLRLATWTFDFGSELRTLFMTNAAYNFNQFSDTEIDSVYKSLDVESDPVKYIRICRSLHQMMHEKLPYIFLWSVKYYSVVTTDVYGVQIHPFRYFTWFKYWEYLPK